MAQLFVKIFASILDSSIWSESGDTCKVWITMLCMADEEGFVRSSASGLARRAAVSADACSTALSILEAPDPDSHTPDHDGRRIERVQGGWMVLNYRAYRELRTPQQVRAAEKQARYRAKKKGDASGDTVDTLPMSTDVPTIDSDSVVSSKSSKRDLNTRKSAATEEPPGFADAWAAYPKRAGGNPRKAALDKYRARINDGAAPAELLAGTERFAAYVRGTGREQTEFVMQAARFYGPDGWWSEPWDLPKPAPGTQEAADAELQALLEAERDRPDFAAPPDWRRANDTRRSDSEISPLPPGPAQ